LNVAPVVALGECMLELSRSGAGQRLGEGWRLSFAGDTFNTAIYMQRLGAPVAYFTALGTDPYSDEMRAAWAAEGIDLSLVLRDPERMPGLYAIRTSEAGERSFSYWRSNSAARRLFQLAGTEAALDQVQSAELLYLSGITLSLFDANERARLCEIARRVRERGGQVAFDPNYRPAGWPDIEQARASISAMAAHVSIALPTFDDERLLWGDASPGQTAERWRRLGASEVVVKLGKEGCLIGAATNRQFIAALPVSEVVDSTGAGDSFNAAFLIARRTGRSLQQAAMAGNRLASLVIQHRGAIIPLDRFQGKWSDQ
jgi:2-dehydro-3-deoxygluconokinase